MNSIDPSATYGKLLSDSLFIRTNLVRQDKLFSAARLLTFAGSSTFAILALVGSTSFWLPAFVLFAGFIFLLVLHEKMLSRQKFNNSIIHALNHELQAIQGNFTSFEGGTYFIDHSHSYATDLDIFGEYSLFQAINRTTTPLAKKILAENLLSPLKTAEEIIKRQNSIKELVGMPEWRIRLRAFGLVADENDKDIDLLFEWFKLKPIFHRTGFKISTLLIPAFSVASTILMVAGIISLQLFLLYMMVPLLITGFYTKTINRRHLMLSRKVELLKKYGERFRLIEDEHFESALLLEYQQSLHSGKFTAAYRIGQLGRITSSLDTRLNILAGFILNFLLLWDIRQMRRLEQWLKVNCESAPIWFNTLAEAETLASLSSFAYINPEFNYPEINGSRFSIESSEAGHPLIPASQRVNNDIHLTHHGHFNIITGANMAGKSTYLRTVGVNMVLALCGAPVCAKTFVCYPAPVFTSLRTNDSLSANKSYFYAELLRLKEIIDLLKSGNEIFILLDEILKGTNSIDKQTGSKALLVQLIEMGASGFIATHDLELGNLEQLFPGHVSNYSFEASIKGDELHFDYKLKRGIAKNLNATFLMQKMGITIKN
ncbi:MAG: hypothetical protein K0B15_09655 [Lentimicrobium sp.]|nr:hypothetical protein [Lentimicrobium sp.]